MKKKTVALLMACVMAVGCVVGGSLAWLVSKPEAVVNTFTYGDINIDLWEHKYVADENELMTGDENLTKLVDNYKIIPGVTLPKDPFVVVEKGSEACWLFVKVEENGTFVEGKVTYEIDDSVWTAGTKTTTDEGNGVPVGVYYCEAPAVAKDAANDATYNVLKDKQVVVSDQLTKQEIENLPEANTLKFTAYAIQKEGITNAADAWAKANA